MSRTKVVLGKVLSNKMQKTIVVGIERRFRHPRYGKVVSKMTKLYAHTEQAVDTGDIVAVVQTRPLSRLKRWRVVKVIAKGEEELALPQENEGESND